MKFTEYKILVNQASGTLSKKKKADLLWEAKKRFGDCEIFGFNTKSEKEFQALAREIAPTCRTLAIAGGDGTVLSILNAGLDPKQIFGYIPLGSGNALAHEFERRVDFRRRHAVMQAVRNIKEGRHMNGDEFEELDVLLCKADGYEQKRALFASVGVEAFLIHEREKTLDKNSWWLRALPGAGLKSAVSYLPAFLKSVFTYTPEAMMIQRDERSVERWERPLSIEISKVRQNIGYGCRGMPDAVHDDGLLHTMALEIGMPRAVASFVMAFFWENRLSGEYNPTREYKIISEADVDCQLHGDHYATAKEFEFKVDPRSFRMRF